MGTNRRVTIGGRGQGKERRRISRRRFLAETTLAGAALTLPGWMVGCGGDDGAPAASTPTPTATPDPRPRERRTLNFDFSFGNLRDVHLVAVNSPSNGAAILAHTAASRAKVRQQNAALAEVPDEHLTHYVEDVELPADALQLIMARGVDADSGAAALAALYVHVPSGSTAAGPNSAQTIENLVINVKGFITPWDTAVALLFHSPEMMNLNVDQGGAILGMINSLPCPATSTNCTDVPFLQQVASVVAESWPATTSGGWATLVQVSDVNGKPVVDGNGNPVYRYDLSSDVVQAVTAVSAQIKPSIFNAVQFQGTNWHPTEGITVRENASTGAGAASFAVTASQPPGTHVHGVKFTAVNVTNALNRTVQLQFRNDYLRFLSAYVQFANAAGDLPVQNPTKDDTSRSKFLGSISSNYTVLGIPLFGNDVPLSSVEFPVPADASIAKVYFGSLGTGGDAFCPEAVHGSILTLIINIGIPSLFLAAGVAFSPNVFKQLLQVSGDVYTFMRSQIPLILGLAGSDLHNGIFGDDTSGTAVKVLVSLANAVLDAFFATADGAAFLLKGFLQTEITQTAVDSALGPIGLALRLVAIAADVATIAQSVGEVLANPAIFHNTLSLTMTTTVTISHDPNDFQFPAEARNYEVTLTYDSASKVAHKQKGTIEPGRTEPIVVTFDDVPSGGMVTADVYLTTESGCIVGRSTDANGNVGPYGPVPGTQAEIPITIKELLIPLTDNTKYLHDVKLEYQNGQHVWLETAAPTATVANLMQGNGDALNDVTGITLSQRTGVAGYSYLAGGQGIDFCGQSTSGIMHVLQNIFLGEDPDSALKQLPCGFQQTSGIAYEKLGSPTSTRNFFLQPSELGFLLQSVTLEDGKPFDVENPLTWGVFSEPLASLVVVPTGYVVGVDRLNHKMQILELPKAPSNPVTAPQAVPFAVSKMGPGSRVGLLQAPVAATVFDAAILILEEGNRRIQAVDVWGNPVLRFQNGTTSIIELDHDDGVVYLDIGVEGLGYLYVLSYVNDGRAAADYRLDVFTPEGTFLTRTTGIAAARLAVDTFRNVYALNYETVAGAPRVEPSLSQWVPSTPGGCPTPPAS